jgi:hypothetical protein
MVQSACFERLAGFLHISMNFACGVRHEAIFAEGRFQILIVEHHMGVVVVWAALSVLSMF